MRLPPTPLSGFPVAEIDKWHIRPSPSLVDLSHPPWGADTASKNISSYLPPILGPPHRGGVPPAPDFHNKVPAWILVVRDKNLLSSSLATAHNSCWLCPASQYLSVYSHQNEAQSNSPLRPAKTAALLKLLTALRPDRQKLNQDTLTSLAAKPLGSLDSTWYPWPWEFAIFFKMTMALEEFWSTRGGPSQGCLTH